MILAFRRPEERNGSRLDVEADLNAKDDDGTLSGFSADLMRAASEYDKPWWV